MEGYGRITALAGPRGTRLTELRATGPLALFPTGPAEVTLVAAAGGPLRGDRVVLDLDVGEGAVLVVRSVGASLLLGGEGSSSTLVRASVAGTLRWLPEPTIATAGAEHDAESRIWLADQASLWWREEAVFGRAGEAVGRCRLTLSVDRCGRPLLRQRIEVGQPGWDGPGRLAGHRALASVLVVGEDEANVSRSADASDRRARLELEGGGTLLTAVGQDLRAARRELGQLLSNEALVW